MKIGGVRLKYQTADWPSTCDETPRSRSGIIWMHYPNTQLLCDDSLFR
jgi:hypothetical protein